MEKDLLLRRITNNLIINASFLENPGLYHGKMGIVLFFVHYSRYTGMGLYDDFAGLLLDEIYEEINTWTPVDFENGLAGIGWGIEYLLQNGFMAGDSFAILRELDEKLQESDLNRMMNKSLRNGTGGIACYLQKHLSPDVIHKDVCVLSASFLANWEKYICPEYISQEMDLYSIVEHNSFKIETEVKKWRLGLDGGCAGYGLKMILE